jgi:hypothetical protein
MNKEILEGNKLIAEFMTEDPGVLRRDLKQAGTLESMQYHKSLDLLMPVLERIRVKGHRWEIGMSPISSQYHYCKIWSVGTIGGRSPLDAVYGAVQNNLN